MDKSEVIRKLKLSFNSLDDKLGLYQNKLLVSAAAIGYSRDIIKLSANNYEQFILESDNEEDINDILPTTLLVYDAIKSEVDQLISEHLNIGEISTRSIASSGSNVYSTSCVVSSLYPDQQNTTIPFPNDKSEFYFKQFTKLSPSLGITYKSIDETIYLKTADFERAALLSARQAFDIFLDLLAPDDEVKTSSYWRIKTAKESKNPNAIWKFEKLTYAAYNTIKDVTRRETLLAQAKNILSVYKYLNKLHERGPLNTNASISAAKSMKIFLEEWIDAINN